jgi:Tfp pilus assembly protein PilN
MIRINLLPHREAKRKQKQSAFVAMLALGGLLGAALVLMVGGYNASQHRHPEPAQPGAQERQRGTRRQDQEDRQPEGRDRRR